MGTLISFIFIFSSVIFGALAVYFSLREEKKKVYMEKQQKELTRKLFEVSFLNDISGKIGYSLSIDTVIQTIVTSVENLFSFSTVSYAILVDNTINIKTFAKEPVSAGFVQGVKNIIVVSLNGIDETTKDFHVADSLVQGSVSDIALPFDTVPQSYFNIPLVVNNRVRGIINISSTRKNLFKEEDMSFLYKIINQAVQAIGKLEAVIETEKGKTDSLIASLSSGAMLLLFNQNEMKLSTINEAACSYLHLDKSVTDIKMIFKAFEQSQNIEEKVKEVTAQKTTLVLNDVVLYGKHLKVYISPVFYYDTQEVIGASITMQDVTLEKELEDMRENFTNMVVHELRSPLTAIKGASSLLMSGKLEDEDKSKMLHVIESSTNKGLSEISDLLDAAKIDAGKFGINKKRNDFNLLIKERAEALLYAGREKDITISYHANVGISEFDFDYDRMSQVVDNLLSNSIKYTPQGGKISLSTEQKGHNLELLVSDTGIGISQEKIGVLFSRFAQAGVNQKDSTGLGLFIAKGIIEAHGGTIWIQSHLGEGTDVHVVIPMTMSEQGSIEEKVSHQAAARIDN